MGNSRQGVPHMTTDESHNSVNDRSRSWPVWALGLLMVAVIIMAVVLGMQILEDQHSPKSEKLITPVVGGMSLSGPTALPTASSPVETVSQSPTLTTAPFQFTPGRLVATKDTSVALYSDASSSAVPMDSYGLGARFTVLESTGDYDEYPVEYDGRQWIRVRSADGLAGWVATDSVVPLP
jgi:hypothetical protein